MSTLSVQVCVPYRAAQRPPLLFVHGAVCSGGIWFRWQELMAEQGWASYALDLRGHGASAPVELAEVTMDDYLVDVEAVAAQLGRPPIVVGWSMGGLVALMYLAYHPEAPAGVLLAPSPPAAGNRQVTQEEIAAIPDLFGAEYYGIDLSHPTGGRALAQLEPPVAARILATLGQESGAARRQRLRGVDVSVDAIKCPLLLIHGDRDRSVPPDLCQRVADYYRAETLLAIGAAHWGVVVGPAVEGLAAKAHAWLKERLSANFQQ